MKKRVYVDMDGVLCNFFGAARKALIENPNQKYPQSQWGFFLKLEEIPGAIEAFKKLQEKYTSGFSCGKSAVECMFGF